VPIHDPTTSEDEMLAALLAEQGFVLGEQAIPPRPPGAPVPALPAQARYWSSARLDPADVSNNLAVRLRFAAPVDGDALVHALHELVDRHAALRSRFEQRGEQLLQTTEGVAGVVISRCRDLAGATAMARAPYDLAAGPLVRPVLLVDDEERAAEVTGLVLAFHHAAVDWHSVWIILADLLALYRARCDGQPESVACDVRDYAAWLATRGQGGRHKAYWRERLASVVSSSGVDRRPAGGNARDEDAAGYVAVEIPAMLAASIRNAARAARATEFAVVLAGWIGVFARLEDTQRLVVATSVAHRDDPRAEPVVGPLADMLLLPATLDLDESFGALVRRIIDQCQADLGHADVSLSEQLQLLRAATGGGRDPITNVLNWLGEAPAMELDGEPVEVEALRLGVVRASWLLEVQRARTGLVAHLEYARALVHPQVAACVAAALPSLLTAGLADPELSIARLPLAGPGTLASTRDGPSLLALHQAAIERAEREDVVDGTPTASAGLHRLAPASRPASLVARFRTIAEAHPDAPALLVDAGVRSYAELRERADQFAAALLAHDSPRRVAIALPRSFELVAAYLGGLQAGATVLLLDPTHLPARLRFMLEDSGAGCLICSAVTSWIADRGGARVVLVEEMAPAAGEPVRARPADQPSHLVYTSGSTGQPRAVMASERGLLNRLDWMAAAFPWSAQDVACQKTTVDFVDVHAELFGPLLAGVPSVIVSASEVVTPTALVEVIRRHRVTRLVVVPALLGALLDAVGDDPTPLASLRLCVCSGEALTSSLAQRLTAACPACRLLNLYGSSEVSADVTFHLIEPGVTARGLVPIGAPIAEHRVSVTDPEGRVVPRGFPGEIRVRGPGLALGYWRDAALSAERFGPALDEFRSKDAGYMDGDGTLHYLGRLDQQIKRLGVRIEPAEIREAVLAEVRDRELEVTDVLVGLHGEPGASQSLIAWLLGVDDADEAELRRGLRARLPRSMVPTRVIGLACAPLLPSGKIDRRALAALPLPPPPTAEVRPLTAEEAAMAVLWTELLGVDVSSPEADFFACGGDSLIGISLATRLRASRGCALRLDLLFEAPTLAAYTRALAATVPEASPLSAPRRRDPAVRVPLPPRHARLWAQQLADPRSPAYNEGLLFRLRGRVSATRLAAAIDALVARHEALRSWIRTREGGLFLEVDEPQVGALRVEQVADEGAAVVLAQELMTRPIDLRRQPLLRAVLARWADDASCLIMILHHGVTDGWSGRVATRELSLLYDGRRLPPPELSALDVAAWEAEVASSATARAQRRWWAEALAGASPFRPAWVGGGVEGPTLGSADVELVPGATQQVDRLARQAGATRTAVLLALWATALGRRTDTSRLVIATPVANRGRLELESVVGFIADLSLVPITLEGRVGELVGRVSRTLARIVEQDLVSGLEAAPPGSGWHPSETVAGVRLGFVQRDSTGWDLRLGEVVGRAETLTALAPRLDLALLVDDRADGLRLRLEFDGRTVAGAVVHGLASALAELIASVDGEALVSELPALTRLERAHVAVNAAATISPVPRQRVDALLELAAAREPHASALIADDAILDFATLDEAVTAFAADLRAAAAVAAGDRVAVVDERSPAAIVAQLGVLRAGAVLVLVDAAHPPARVGEILEQARPALLVAAERPPGAVYGGPWLALDRADPHAGAGADAKLDVDRGEPEDAIAAIVFTSGSTGPPKGVRVRHAALCRWAFASARCYGLGVGDRLLRVVSPSFDVALGDLALALAGKAALCVQPAAEVFPGPSLRRALQRSRATHVQLPAAVLEATPENGLHDLRVIVVGGETCSLTTRARWSVGRRVFVGYGPTEATVAATSSLLRADSRLEEIGRPLAGARVHLRTASHEPCPTGTIGRLFIGGPNLAAGYLVDAHAGRDPAGSSFLADPGDRTQRIYDTGDLGWMDEAGRLHFAGRADRQLKIRGVRVEPAEVEAALERLSEVRRALCGVRPLAPGEASPRLVAWVVWRGAPLTSEVVREALAVRLPRPMVPDAIASIERVPLTTTGKVDWAALPDPLAARERSESGAPAVGGELALVDAVRGIWRHVLQVDRVGLDDNFFDLGGHSLQLVAVHTALEQHLGAELPVTELFRQPTVRRLTRYLESLRHELDGPSRARPIELLVSEIEDLGIELEADEGSLRVRGSARALDARLRRELGERKPELLRHLSEREAGCTPKAAQPVSEARVPLTAGQRRLWFIDLLLGHRATFVMTAAWRLGRGLDPEALSRALRSLARRHPILTCRIEDARDAQGEVWPELVFASDPGAALALQMGELGALGDEAALERAVADASERPFDLVAEPPARFALLRHHGGRGEDWLMLLSIHHIVADRWSMGVLMRDLGALYARELGVDAPGLAPLPIDYPTAQRRMLVRGSAVDESVLDAWAEVLSDMPRGIALPFDGERPPSRTELRSAIRRRVPAEVGAAIQRAAVAATATPFMWLLSVYAVLLARWSGQERLVVGCPLVARPDLDTHDLVGFFVDTVALPLSLEGEPSFTEVVGRVREVCADAFDRRAVPFERLVERVRPERRLNESPLFQAMFVVQTAGALNFQLPGVTSEPLPIPPMPPEVDLNLAVEPLAGGGYELYLEYDAALFEDATVARFLEHFEALARAATAGADIGVWELAIAPEQGRRLLAQSRGPAPAVGDADLVADLRRASLERADAPAVVDVTGSVWAHAELEARVAALAGALDEQFGPERGSLMVGLHLTRSAAALVAMLAVLRVGAAFAILPPDHPARRLSAMISEARIRAVIVDPLGEDRLPEDLARISVRALGPAHAPERTRPDQPAYVSFTSGSTGASRAIWIAQAGLANHARAIVHEYSLCASDRALHAGSLAFDVALEELFPTLLAGGTVVIAGENLLDSFEAFDEAIERLGITVLNLPASLWAAWVAHLVRQRRSVPGALRLLIAGSEPVPRESLARWRELAPTVAFRNAYGPTETTITATVFDPDRDVVGVRPQVPIGRALAGLTVGVLDGAGRPVAAGVVGEICVAGPGVALARSGGQGASDFAPLPALAAGQRCYRTGDLGRWRADGVIECLGRRDEQIKIRGFRVEPGDVEAALMRLAGVREAAVVDVPQAEGPPRLLAFVVGEIEPAAALARLREVLPGYLVPAQLVSVDALPSTASGKLDRRALRRLAPEARGPTTAGPKPHASAPESLVARAFAEVLALEQVGRDANFFDLGGDSLMSLRLVDRLAYAGLAATVRDVFVHQTVASLAAELRPQQRVDAHESGIGLVPVTPIQAWFHDHVEVDVHHYNQAAWLVLADGRRVGVDDVREALTSLCAHHECLRLVVRGRGRAATHEIPEQVTPPRVELVDAGGSLAAQLAQLQRSLDPGAGRMVAALLSAAGDRVFLVVHHLVVDAVSFGVLIDDLDLCLRAQARDQRPILRRTTPYRAWAERLVRVAASPEIAAALPELIAGLHGPCGPLDPALVHDVGRVGDACCARGSLDAARTRALLRNLPGRGGRVDAAILAVLAARAGERGNHDALRCDLETHGRPRDWDGIDLTRTVGWFTNLLPLRLTTKPASLGERTIAVTRMLDAQPLDGLAAGLLSSPHAPPELRALMAELPRAQLLVNYLGQLDAIGHGLLRSTSEDTGATVSGAIARSHQVEVNAGVTDEVLAVSVTTPKGTDELAAEIARALVDGLGELAAWAASAAAKPLPDGVESEHAPTGLQLGLLYHSLREPGVYTDRLTLTLDGPLDAACMQRAWDLVCERHDALRSCLCGADGAEPKLHVHREARPSFRVDDWSTRAPADQVELLRAVEAAEVAVGFALDRAPLQRLRLIRLGPVCHVLIWSAHHLIADGWSVSVVLEEVFAIYAALAAGEAPALPRAPRYADYLDGPHARMRDDDESWWRAELGGFEQPTYAAQPGLAPSPGDARARDVPVEAVLSEVDTAALRALASAAGATVGVVLQAAWALLLARYSGRDDVLFGLVVNGREVPGNERLVGMLINTLPVRVRVRGDQSVGEFLGVSTREHGERVQRDRLPPGQVPLLLGLPGGVEPYDSLVVIQNYPHEVGLRTGDLVLSSVAVGERTHHAVTLVVSGTRELRLQLSVDARKLARAAAEAMLEQLQVLLAAMVADPGAALDSLPLLSEERERERRRAASGPRVAVRDIATPTLLHDVVARWGAELAEAPAVRASDGVLDHGELDRAVSNLAGRLLDAGLVPGQRIGLACRRSLGLPVGFLAILRAGGVVVPLDPAYPSERLAHMIEDSGLKLALCGAGVELPAGAAVERLTVEISTDAPELRHWPSRAGTDEAYVTYTSGSTGLPKGVANTHGGLANLTLALREHFGLGPGDRVMQFSSPSFDASVWELAMAFSVAATACLPDVEVALSGPELGSWMQRERINAATVPPSLLAVLPQTTVGRALPDLRLLVVAGEVCPPELARWWARGRRFVNAYGPSEATVCATVADGGADGGALAIGRPIANVEVHVVDAKLRPVPPGVDGELCIGGLGVARAYLNRPQLTDERFVPDPFGARPGARLYRTGDRGRLGFDGQLHFLGRVDRQLKVRGFRVEPAEIEALLTAQPGVGRALCGARRDQHGHDRLLAWIVSEPGATLERGQLRRALAAALPAHLVPSQLVPIAEVPITDNGKIDWAALPEPGDDARTDSRAADRQVGTAGQVGAAWKLDLEAVIRELWIEALGSADFGLDDSFFEVGGHSLLLVDLHGKLVERFGVELPMTELFRLPTIRGLARVVRALVETGDVGAHGRPSAAGLTDVHRGPGAPRPGPIAVVGLAGRFPGAPDLDAYWRMLDEGREGITRFDAASRRTAGVDDVLAAAPGYMPAGGIIEDAECFDARFFGFSPRDAVNLDPQHRLFLQTCWHALESAGIDPERCAHAIGLFAGAGYNTWLSEILLAAGESLAGSGGFHLVTANDKDFLATQVAYRLNLSGPAMTIQSACSTSLVAVDVACQALASGRCGVALAGGVAVTFPQTRGYVYEPGMILSPDGHCRAFAADAAGTVPGSGVGVVVLKRLHDALADGDTIHALIRGSAVNNDGARKVGFTAPGVDGQAAVIRQALANAGLDREDLDYVEAHGTGTLLGDPVEVAALADAYGGRRAPLLLGSVKSNIGHADAAAGVAGLIKVILALGRGRVPASLHAEVINPTIDLAAGPFEVVRASRPWPEQGRPKRAGVSSFGIGGTNAHVIVEEAPATTWTKTAPQRCLLPLSASDGDALRRQEGELARWLVAHPEVALADVAYTLQDGRRALAHRSFVVAQTVAEADARLRGRGQRCCRQVPETGARAALMLPGQGSQHPRMAAQLLARDRAFRAHLETCEAILRGRLGPPLLELIQSTSDAARLRRTELAQPIVFAMSWALAMRWREVGLTVDGFIGHSVGEYTAACLAGVFELEAALDLMVRRGRLIAELERGAMLAVPLGELEVRDLLRKLALGASLDVAAVNAPRQTVIAGPESAVAELTAGLGQRSILARRLETSHAFHSAMMEPAMDSLAALVAASGPREPTSAFISNVTGDWIEPRRACDPAYWAKHLRAPVRFAAGLQTLADAGFELLVEAGPGQALSGFAHHASWRGVCTPSLAHPVEHPAGGDVLPAAVGQVWMAGHDIGWSSARALMGDERVRGRKLPLPPYAFALERHWPAGWRPRRPDGSATTRDDAPLAKRPDMSSWFYRPVWRAVGPLANTTESRDRAARESVNGEGVRGEAAAPRDEPATARSWETTRDETWLVLCDRGVVEQAFVRRLRDAGARVTVLTPRDSEQLEDALARLPGPPARMVHMWTLAAMDEASLIERGLHCVLTLVRWFGQSRGASARLDVVTRGGAALPDAGELRPGVAAMLAALEVLPYEFPRLRVHGLSVDQPDPDALWGWLVSQPTLRIAAMDCERRLYQQAVESIDVPAARPIAPGGTHLITGGFGGIGSLLAEHLAERGAAHLVLLGRPRAQPDPERGALCQRLRDRGARVTSVELDLGDRGAVLARLPPILEELGVVDHVLHAAGLADYAGVVQRRSKQDTDLVMAAKSMGTRALLDAFAEVPTPPRVMVLFSTLGSFLPAVKFGQIGYAAANGYLDLAAHAWVDGRTRLVTIHWDDWTERGMTVEAHRRDGTLTLDATTALTPAEGAEALARVLASGELRVAVSIRALPELIEAVEARAGSERGLAGAPASRAQPGEDAAAAGPEEAPTSRGPGTLEDRLARDLARILGVASVRPDDNFFELGGHSLLAMQLLAAVREREQLEIGLADVFECPTPRSLAARIEGLT
jgi:amino acid adenylation domain-containing protein